MVTDSKKNDREFFLVRFLTAIKFTLEDSISKGNFVSLGNAFLLNRTVHFILSFL